MTREYSELSEAQRDAITRLYETDHTLLLGDMGSGKTVVALSAGHELLRDGELRRLLVFAPNAVAQTVWPVEARGWSHLQDCHVVHCEGTAAQRLAILDNLDNRIVVLGLDLVPWLCKQPVMRTFDGLIVDEATKLSNVGGAWVKSLRHHLKRFKWRVGMTGTSATENWIKIYGQMLIIDGGAALGRRKDRFLMEYFYPTDWDRRNWELQEGAAERIMARIRSALCILPDYRHELPDLHIHRHMIEMPEDLMGIYRRLARDMLVELSGAGGADGELIKAANRAVLSGKLEQVACGFVYTPLQDATDGPGVAQRISEYRIRAVCQHVFDLVRGGERVLLTYWYTADRDALLRELREVCGVDVEALTQANRRELIEMWNAGSVDVLLLHPNSAGHGTRLEQGGHRLVMFKPFWSRDLWEQLIARIWRRGQAHDCHVDVFVAGDTVDELIMDALDHKAEHGELFARHLEQTGKS